MDFTPQHTNCSVLQEGGVSKHSLLEGIQNLYIIYKIVLRPAFAKMPLNIFAGTCYSNINKRPPLPSSEYVSCGVQLSYFLCVRYQIKINQLQHFREDNPQVVN